MDFLKKGRSLIEKIKPILMDEEPELEMQQDAVSEENSEGVEVNSETNSNSSKPERQPKSTLLGVVGGIFNGGGIGFLLGILLGMSLTPVVGEFIGVLSGMLAVLLGLSDKFISTAKAFRLGAFGFFCVGGIFLGMYVRANNGMLPSSKAMMEEYLELGFTAEESRDFIAFQKLGLVPVGWKGADTEIEIADSTVEENNAEPTEETTQEKAVADSPEKEPLASKANSSSNSKSTANTSAPKKREFANTNATGAQFASHLYSSEVSMSNCMRLNLLSDITPLEEVKNSFRKSDGEKPGVWTWMADGLDPTLPEDVQKQVLLNMVTNFCNNDELDKVVLEDCSLKPNELEKLPLADIRQKLTAQGEVWKSLVYTIVQDISEDYHKSILINLTENICHD